MQTLLWFFLIAEEAEDRFEQLGVILLYHWRKITIFQCAFDSPTEKKLIYESQLSLQKLRNLSEAETAMKKLVTKERKWANTFLTKLKSKAKRKKGLRNELQFSKRKIQNCVLKPILLTKISNSQSLIAK